MEQMDEDHGGDGHDDQVLGLEKKKEKNKKLKAKVKLDRSFLVWWSRHLASVITFRIDSRTIKRGETRIEYCYQSVTRYSNSLHMHLDSSES